MTLKSIELIGFKSFGKKSILTFSTPVTAIVGPNGSGKSNIVEAIRFVLGEQSMKSLRSKSGSDLIFKGSKDLAAASRGSVNLTFDNSNKNFKFTNSGLGLSLDYDEIIISREVFPDGSNNYSINGTEVRLKDIVDLLASVNIGSSGHHIISQGESDHVLNSTNKERKSMIEDALGLRIYQYRILESERKLEKTILNMKEVGSLRREIAPHLNFLKKQVQIVEKAKSLREELRVLYKTYISIESTYINNETKRLEELNSTLNEKNRILDEEITLLRNNKSEDKQESQFLKEIKENEEKLKTIRANKDQLSRSLGRVDGILESLKHQSEKVVEKKERIIPLSQLELVMSDVEKQIDGALEMTEMSKIIEILTEIKEKINSLHNKVEDNTPEPNLSFENEIKQIKIEQNNINKELNKINSEEENILSIISSLRSKEKEKEESLREGEHTLYEKLNEKNKVVSSIHSYNFDKEKLQILKNAYEIELTEAGVLVGREIVSFTQIVVTDEIIRQEQEGLRRKIERIKIKIENAGTGNGDEVIKEFKETEERDLFLEKELLDLKNSIDGLNILIKELKDTLDKEFKEGVVKINNQFQHFFALMFGGGKASLSLTMEYKRNKKNYNSEDGLIEKLEEEETELDFERGIEIDISLPHKKVKELNMLSGGERSLTSIALLFAISQVNPPPFLVLDETDAALDEANSRKYGDMILNLSKYSELIIVTHNRETMSRAGVLYGVTMSSVGVSKFLSIHLEDATNYAK